MATVPVMATLHLPPCHGHLPSGCVTQLAQRRSPALQPAVQPSQHMHCKARTGLANLSPGRKETRTTRYGELRPGVALVHIDRQHDLSLCCARREATAPFLAHLATLSARLGPRRSGSRARATTKREERDLTTNKGPKCVSVRFLWFCSISLSTRARVKQHKHTTQTANSTPSTPVDTPRGSTPSVVISCWFSKISLSPSLSRLKACSSVSRSQTRHLDTARHRCLDTTLDTS